MAEPRIVLYRDYWFEGYDGEYEYSVAVYPDHIEWDLQFDEQWSTKPVNIIQDINDYNLNGPPPDFRNVNSYYLKEVEKTVKKNTGL